MIPYIDYSIDQKLALTLLSDLFFIMDDSFDNDDANHSQLYIEILKDVLAHPTKPRPLEESPLGECFRL
jgi:hypothetical protein